MKQRAKAINALRAYLHEFGHVAPEGPASCQKLALLVADPGSSLLGLTRDICRMAMEQVKPATARSATVTAKIAAASGARRPT